MMCKASAGGCPLATAHALSSRWPSSARCVPPLAIAGRSTAVLRKSRRAMVLAWLGVITLGVDGAHGLPWALICPLPGTWLWRSPGLTPAIATTLSSNASIWSASAGLSHPNPCDGNRQRLRRVRLRGQRTLRQGYAACPKSPPQETDRRSRAARRRARRSLPKYISSRSR
jgi:hypothetical protein